MPLRVCRAGRLFGCALLFLARLVAQDIIVGDPVWFSTDPAPDVALKTGNLKPTFPDEMKNGDDVGYVIVSRNVDAAGKNISMIARGTHVPFQKAVEESFRLGWTLPQVKRDGKRVAARLWVPVIFNPKSANPKSPDATPRVLVAAPALTQIRPVPGNDPQVVRMKLAIDAAGAMTSAEPVAGQRVSTNLRTALDAALKEWRFAPARKAGQPVAAEIVVPVLCHGMRRDQGNFMPARILESVRPIYPVAMRRYGINGSVTFDYTIDEDGRVKNPVIHESNSPAFEEPALLALRQWKYQPAMRDGKAVSSRVRQTIALSFGEAGDSAYKISEKLDQSKVPPEWRYDTAPKIRGVLVPVHPYALRRDSVRGRAKLAMVIDERGRVAGLKVIEMDRPEFAGALAAALEGFSFDPAYRDGKPVQSRISFEQMFSPYELPDEEGDELLVWEKRSPEKIVPQTQLDLPLKPVSKREPKFPVLAPPELNDGEAVVECLVDKNGRVRLARVKSATADIFGYAAVQAASAWWFEPPMSKGKAVVVREEIPFRFRRAPGKAK